MRKNTLSKPKVPASDLSPRQLMKSSKLDFDEDSSEEEESDSDDECKEEKRKEGVSDLLGVDGFAGDF
jgi:hypothetical protein